MEITIDFQEEDITEEVISRILQKIQIPESIWDCWIWIAGKSDSKYTNGYGKFNLNGRSIYAHRYVYFLANRRNPSNTIDHLCNNTLCMNPLHLQDEIWAINSGRTKWAISSHCQAGHRWTENNTYHTTDGKRKCRECIKLLDKKHYHNKYEKSKIKKTNNSNTVAFKLTDEQIQTIRNKYQTGEFSQRELSREYSVSQPNIGFIVRGETYKNIHPDFRKIEPTHCSKNHKYNDINKSYTKEETLLCRECVKLTNIKRLQYKLEWQRQKQLKNQQD